MSHVHRHVIVRDHYMPESANTYSTNSTKQQQPNLLNTYSASNSGTPNSPRSPLLSPTEPCRQCLVLQHHSEAKWKQTAALHDRKVKRLWGTLKSVRTDLPKRGGLTPRTTARPRFCKCCQLPKCQRNTELPATPVPLFIAKPKWHVSAPSFRDLVLTRKAPEVMNEDSPASVPSSSWTPRSGIPISQKLGCPYFSWDGGPPPTPDKQCRGRLGATESTFIEIGSNPRPTSSGTMGLSSDIMVMAPGSPPRNPTSLSSASALPPMSGRGNGNSPHAPTSPNTSKHRRNNNNPTNNSTSTKKNWKPSPPKSKYEPSDAEALWEAGVYKKKD